MKKKVVSFASEEKQNSSTAKEIQFNSFRMLQHFKRANSQSVKGKQFKLFYAF